MKPNVVAIAGKIPEHAGAVIWWRLSGDVDIGELTKNWTLPKKLLPKVASPKVALTRAVGDLKEKDRFIRRFKGEEGGYVIVNEKKDDVKIMNFEVQCHVYLDDSYRIVIDPMKHHLRKTIQQSFERHQTLLEARDIGHWLSTKVTDALKAVSLRDTGGVYFVPHGSLPMLKKLTTVLKKCTDHVLFQIPALKSDEAVAAIVDALLREAAAEAKSVEDAIDTRTLGPRALKGKEAQCKTMIEKLASYEEFLGKSLDKMRDRLTKLASAAMEASMAADRGQQSLGF